MEVFLRKKKIIQDACLRSRRAYGKVFVDKISLFMNGLDKIEFHKVENY